MTIIQIRPAPKFKGWWEAFEIPGVQPVFEKKELAISYALNARFGGRSGEIHIYDDTDQTVVEKIKIEGGSQYGQPQQSF